MRQVKARYWTAVTYPENMIDDWQIQCGDILQFPYCYCIHDKDHLAKHDDKEEEDRKVHVHWIIAFNNTTTYNHALEVFKKLSKPGFSCLNKVEDINGIRHVYDYLIHDTETCRKVGKYQYDKKDRICGNNFDIGAYEQLSEKERHDMLKEMELEIYKNGFCNFSDFLAYITSNYDDKYLIVLRGYSAHFERITKGMFQRITTNISAKKSKKTESKE